MINLNIIIFQNIFSITITFYSNIMQTYYLFNITNQSNFFYINIILVKK